MRAAALSLLALLPYAVKAYNISASTLVVTDPSTLEASYDYVVVGGGTAGLAVASRLAQAGETVVVIEAGGVGSDVMDQVLPPAMSYLNGVASLTSAYDWHYETIDQDNLNNRSIFWPRGKIVGGSSAVNGLYMIRGAEAEYNAWGDLITGGSTAWGWDAMSAALRRSENFTGQPYPSYNTSGVVAVDSAHGYDGPIAYGYPGYYYKQIDDWIPALENLGVDCSNDPATGAGYGGFIATSAIADGRVRSYAVEYLEGISSGLTVLSGYQATKIVFDNTTATGVQFATNTSSTYTVSAGKEVILAAGVIGSPHLLLLSGIGDNATLRGLDIEPVVDLPGVGRHLTDHLSGSIVFNSTGVAVTADKLNFNSTFQAAQLAAWEAGSTDSLYTAPNDAVAYVNMSTLFDYNTTAVNDFLAQVSAVRDEQITAYSSNPKVQRGYNLTYTAELDTLYNSDIGMAEILFDNTGTYGSYGDDLTIQIQFAIQHPMSRGSVSINSSSAFDAPLIDAGYLVHPTDVTILVQAVKFVRNLAATSPLSEILATELTPGTDVSTDAEIEAWLRRVVSTEYHPASTCSMLPQEDGGVVDPLLRVYGTSNLRVIDSSIIPIGLSAHLTAPTYGVAENGAQLLTNATFAASVESAFSGTSLAVSSASSAVSTSATSRTTKAASTKTTAASTISSKESTSTSADSTSTSVDASAASVATTNNNSSDAPALAPSLLLTFAVLLLSFF